MTTEPETPSVAVTDASGDAYRTYYDRIRAANQRLAQGHTTWWRRSSFTDPKVMDRNPKAKPKWHIYTGRKAVTENAATLYTYTAACGYSYAFWETILQIPLFRDDIKTANLRCTKCEKAIATKR